MALIQWIQAIAPPAVVACVAPLIIIACILLAFGDWLYPKWRTAGFAYALSIGAFPVVNHVAQLGLMDSALVSGIFVPAIGGFIWVLNGILQTLNLPTGGRLGTGRLGNAKGGTHFWITIGHAVLGVCVGGVLGLALGLVVSLTLLGALSLLAVLPPDLANLDQSLTAAVLDAGIYTLGGLGASIGILVGSGALRTGALIEKGLISAVIYSAVITRWFRTLLHIPVFQRWWQRMHPPRSIAQSTTSTALQRRPDRRSINIQTSLERSISQQDSGRFDESGRFGKAGRFDVTQHNNSLILRCRTYRSTDWVWMGFNGFYVLFTLLVGAIALLRGTWLTLGLGISLIVLTGALWTWHSMTRLLNYTTITITPNRLTRRDAPLPSFASPIRLPLQHIAAIQADARPRRGIGERFSAVPEYCVCAELLDGRRIYLLRHLERWEEAVFVEEQVNGFRCQKSL